ncbi:hypothetical protein M8997_013855 [Phyllobacterium sp. 21LDTY02-6]|jgi:uncharacterized SAM-dependent methyltransferase|uniref:hypothetical protein n=1 Tax=unclassified Phyllobacterium TaxID=2638441 RepID=UPI0020220A84|nr:MULTISPECIES: hypothetical protein [unclassified Phyllobacterium]MCO4318275.1 hypothetical protein [Phyllobacterium sp. 21LDTY02-6]MCX8280270.1 hypothetical protein [Phyllobacterium sp. 0TCS1.6C]MCX8294169.1 hypothetical protein [Phyllobacterium sp. 0TCS1.6A]
MGTPQISNVSQQQASNLTPEEQQQEFEAALNEAIVSGGSSLIGQEMMKIANEILNEALSDE